MTCRYWLMSRHLNSEKLIEKSKEKATEKWEALVENKAETEDKKNFTIITKRSTPSKIYIFFFDLKI